MTLQSGQASESTPITVHQFGLANCPPCGQEIPPDSSEEIGGKLQLRSANRNSRSPRSSKNNMRSRRHEPRAKAKADLNQNASRVLFARLTCAR